METILITGGAGFIGSHLVNYYSQSHRVVVIDDLSMGKLSNIKESENVDFFYGDITNKTFLKKVWGKYTFDYVFHLGAIASVADSIERPLETHQVNQDATLFLLDLALKQKKSIKRFLFTSSASVYGHSGHEMQGENDAVSPLSPYAVDKYGSETYTILYNQLFELNTTAVRFFNVYGSRQNPYSPYSGVMSILTEGIQQKLKGNDFCFIKYGDGEQSRDFVYIKDVIRALILLAQNEKAIGNVFNIGTGVGTTLNKTIQIYQDVSNVVFPIKQEAARLGEIKNSLADISKLKELGYQPKYSIEEGIEDYWNELKGND